MTVLDRSGNIAPPPEWLRLEAGAVQTKTWLEQSTAMHPSERGAVHAVWWQAIRHPGAVEEVICRSKKEDGWHRLKLSIVNLLAHEDVDAVLWKAEDLGPTDDVDAFETDPSEGYESPAWAILHLDVNGLVVRAEGMVPELFGRPAAALIGRPVLKFIHRDHHDVAMAMWLELLATPTIVPTVHQQILRPDSSTVSVEATIINHLADDDGAVIWVGHDVTERRAKEAALRASQDESSALAAEARRMADEFRLLAEEVPSAVFRADMNGRITFGNARWSELVNPSGPLVTLGDAVHEEDRAAVDAAVRELVSPSGPGSRTLEVRSADGRRMLSLTCRALGDPGVDRHTIIGAIHDVTLTTELRHRAEYDVLTGVFNRDSINRQLEVAISSRRNGTLVIFVDLDGFKQVNDLNGHDAGDIVLRGVAQGLRSAVRPSDDVGRYGGDEFVLICYDAASAAETRILNRIDAVLSHRIDFPTGGWIPQASVGVARLQAGDDAAEALQRADRSMYEVKRGRRAGAPARIGFVGRSPA